MIADLCPKIDFEYLEKELLDKYCTEYQYLFYKKVDVFDGFTTVTPVYTCYCSACKEYFNIDKKTKITSLVHCPHCVAKIKVKKWVDDRSERGASKLDYLFLYKHWIRGIGKQVWVRIFKCHYSFIGSPSEEKINFTEVNRICYDEWEAVKFTNQPKYSSEIGWYNNFNKVRNVSDVNWNKGIYYGDSWHDEHTNFGEFEIKNTCLQYSQWDTVGYRLNTIEYFAFYVKNPMIENLTKSGFKQLVIDGFGKKADFLKVINTKAKSFDKLFKHFDKQDIKFIGNKEIPLERCLVLTNLKKHKIIKKVDENALIFAESGISIIPQLLNNIYNSNSSELYKYILKQKAKSNTTIEHTIIDYYDYIRQIEQLNLTNMSIYPGDLNFEHTRLSERIQKAAKANDNQKFRTIRKLLAYTVFRFNNWIIRPIDSHVELIREGEQNGNCVAAYKDRHLKGENVVLVIRDRQNIAQSLYTVEFNTKTNRVIQCRGYKNRKMDDVTEKRKDVFLEHWKKHLEKVRSVKNNRKAG